MRKSKNIFYAHITSLRQQMEKEEIDLWYDAGTDPHLGEYVPDRWKTRSWLSGFTGSAGTLLITRDCAGLWTDSRYHIQAEKELKGSGITLYCAGKKGVPSVEDYIMKTIPPRSVLAFNGFCIPASKMSHWEKIFVDKDFKYRGDLDLPGRIWKNRPPLPHFPVFRYDLTYSGERSPQKIERIRHFLLEKHSEGIFFTLLDEIAWVLNIRGRDISFNPLVISYLWCDRDRVIWFVSPDKVPQSLAEELNKDGVECQPYEKPDKMLSALCTGKHVFIDKSKISFHYENRIRESALKIVESESPVIHFKSVKNTTEQKGIRAAHIRDGIAMVRWMHWLTRIPDGEKHTEITISDKLETFRADQENFRGLSFPTIAGYEEHGAIVHYSPTEKSASVIKPRGILLVDSGAHYLEGTTDITRTIALSEATDEQKKHFTLVLKGLINLSMAHFPEGTTGANLDILARRYLWHEGLNYGHGTGHGVGCYLNVHEGPQRISLNSNVPLKPGMLISNEPGIYFEGKYGMRIENLILCQKSRCEGFLEFETVTRCPVDLNLIDASLFTSSERHWLNRYHKLVYDALQFALNEEEKTWLKRNTQPL
jgi:Xaa-Pro aminopeptidase